MTCITTWNMDVHNCTNVNTQIFMNRRWEHLPSFASHKYMASSQHKVLSPMNVRSIQVNTNQMEMRLDSFLQMLNTCLLALFQFEWVGQVLLHRVHDVKKKRNSFTNLTHYYLLLFKSCPEWSSPDPFQFMLLSFWLDGDLALVMTCKSTHLP